MGPASIGAFFESGLEFSNDHQYTLVSEHSTPDRFVIEWEMAGTHTGDAGGKGFAATNKPYRIRGISTGWLDSHGKITTNRDDWNLADLLMQIVFSDHRQLDHDSGKCAQKLACRSAIMRAQPGSWLRPETMVDHSHALAVEVGEHTRDGRLWP